MYDVVIIDYGLGNIGSIINMFKRIGYKALFTSNRDDIKNAHKIILPGVGSFDVGMKKLKEMKLDLLLKEVLENNNVTLLGICLGMQLLLEESEEGSEKGLGLIPGHCKKFKFKDRAIKVPHMGWNLAYPMNELLFSDENLHRYYFVHSYYACCDTEFILSETNYDEIRFASAIYSKNVFGVQFHPEKSHKYGISLLKKFMEI